VIDVLDPFGRIDEEMARMKRREPVLRSILARIPSFAAVDEVPVTQKEYDTLLDGQTLPDKQVMTVWGKPVVVRENVETLLRASDIAERLGVTRQWAAQVIKTIPGAFPVRETPILRRQVWKVDERAFELWRAGFKFPPLTGGT
jgi:hypothetical protein